MRPKTAAVDGRGAIVTGAARGIGRGIATVLAAEGARVAIADIDPEQAEATANEMRVEGLDAVAVQVDVTDRASTDAMAAAAARRGRIDIVAANAGIYPILALASIDDAEWDRVMDINAKGALHTLQACLRAMLDASYGRIVLTSSITGPITGHPGLRTTARRRRRCLG